MPAAAPAMTGAAKVMYVTAFPSSFMANSKAPYMPRHEHTRPRARAPSRIGRTMERPLSVPAAVFADGPSARTDGFG
jgi:hypothetical protein